MNYLKWFVGIVALIILTVFAFVPFADTEEKYKCLAELYPEQAKVIGVPKLGDLIIGAEDEGKKHRVIGEAKKLKELVWFQFIDTEWSEPGYLDNQCDAVLRLYVSEGAIHIDGFFTPEEVYPSIIRYCYDNGIKMEDFIHKAEPLKPDKPETEI